MDNQLAPNKTGNQFGRLDPSSTGYDQMAGNPNMMGMAPQMYPGQNGMAFQGGQMPMHGMGAGMGMQSMMQGGTGSQDRTREVAQKIRRYKECGERAAQRLSQIVREPVDATDESVENALAKVLKNGTYKEVAKAFIAGAKYAHSCAEKETAGEEAAEQY